MRRLHFTQHTASKFTRLSSLITIVLATAGLLLYWLEPEDKQSARAGIELAQAEAPLANKMLVKASMKMINRDPFRYYESKPEPVAVVEPIIEPDPIIIAQEPAEPGPDLDNATLTAILTALDGSGYAVVKDNRDGAERLLSVGTSFRDSVLIEVNTERAVFQLNEVEGFLKLPELQTVQSLSDSGPLSLEDAVIAEPEESIRFRPMEDAELSSFKTLPVFDEAYEAERKRRIVPGFEP